MVGTDLAARRARHLIGTRSIPRLCACGAADCDAAVAFAALETTQGWLDRFQGDYAAMLLKYEQERQARQAAEAAARVAEQHLAALQAESAHLQAVIRHNWTPRAEQAEAEGARVWAALERLVETCYAQHGQEHEYHESGCWLCVAMLEGRHAVEEGDDDRP